MAEFVALPKRTYGLIVGIEGYLDTSWNVKGGGLAYDALKFAQWLDARGVPQENIRLCLSPMPSQRGRSLSSTSGLFFR